MRNKIFLSSLVFSLFFIPLAWAEGAPKFVYRVGILSTRSVSESRAQWLHLGFYLKDKVPQADFAIVPMNFREIERAVRNNDLDFVLTNPAQYVDLNEKFGVEGLATMESYNGTDKASLYAGTAFVRSDNQSIASWRDLKGKKFVTIDESSFGGWLSVWRELKASGVDPFRDFRSLRFLGIPERVVEAVLNGEADAGSMRMGELERMAQQGTLDLRDIRVIHDRGEHTIRGRKVRMLHSTPFYPEWMFARTHHATDDLSKAVAMALFQMAQDDLAAVAGGYAGWTVPQSYASALACLKEIGFGPFRNYGKISEREIFRIYRWRILGILGFFIAAFGCVFYVLYLNRSLLKSKKKLEEEIRAKSRIEADLRRNEMALKNMVLDLAKTHDSLQSARDQLLQSEKLAAIGQLAAGVAHELNNPLGFVSSNLAILQEHAQKINEILDLYRDLPRIWKTSGDDALARAITEVELKTVQYDLEYVLEDSKNIYTESLEGAERMCRIIKDLKTFAREDRTVRADEDLREVMESILGIVHNEIKYKAVLVKEYAEDLPRIMCNKQQISQVFINILLNAAQAIDKNGKIRLKIYQEGNVVKVDITDTGAGIPEQNLKKIFEPFFSTKDVGKGTGLGLSISYDIVQKHGGTLSVVSKVGQGSTFTIALPLRPRI